MYIPLRLKYTKEFWKKKGFRAEKWTYKEVEVVCYNEIYPRAIEIDSAFLVNNDKFRVGDLINILPPGIKLSPKFEKKINQNVVNLSLLERTLKETSYMFDEEKYDKYMQTGTFDKK